MNLPAPTVCLIVDDHADIRMLVRMTLELEGFDIHECSDAAQARDAIDRLRPGLLMLDVMLPGGTDGLALCRRLRADPACAQMRILLLSARVQPHDIDAGLAAGADAYMVKPFSPRRLLETVASIRPASWVSGQPH